MAVEIVQIQPDETKILEGVLDVFASAFDDADTYVRHRPTPDYLRGILRSEYFICLGALKDGRVVGGIAAYELKKFEQARSEIYIYDLAVDAAHRREGIATKMILRLKDIARFRGAYVIFVQADTAPEDMPAVALYSKMGKREEVLHFDIEVE